MKDFDLTPKDIDRLVNKFILPENITDCWLWTATTGTTEYGTFSIKGRMKTVHRAIYHNFVENLKGPHEVVCHKCDNPKCINPTHLFKGTQLENIQDRVTKGRTKSHYTERTHCKNGHKYTKINTRMSRKGRVCRTCQREKNMRYYYEAKSRNSN